ncbi:MAG: T9SS type A sorting domain-containing protein [Cyclobacteriaceae bacterium]
MALNIAPRILKVLFTVVVLSTTNILCNAQVGNYRSLGSGPWNTAGTWERDADSNGSFEESPSTVAPVTITGTVTIQAGHNITYNVPSGGSVNSGGTIVNNGTVTWAPFPPRVLNINSGGSFQNNGSTSAAAPSKLKFNSGSSYFHLHTDGGTIPLAQWDANSSMNITGMGSGAFTRPAGLNQIFGNFIWNTPSFDSFIDLEGEPSTIAGDFEVNDTGAGFITYNFGSGLPGNNNATLAIGGDLEITNGFFGFTSGIGSSGSLTINTLSTPGKGLKVSGGFTQIGNDDNVSLIVNGIVDLTAGDLELSGISSTVTFNIFGDYSFTGGNLYSTGGTTTMTFSGTSEQIVTTTNNPSGNLNYVIASNAIVSIPDNNFLGGSGDFTLASNGTLRVGSPDSQGALRLLQVGGNLRVTGARTYTNPSTIEYNGTLAQFIGNGHPTVTGVNTIINNNNGVSLIVGVPAIITTNLTLTDGNLNIGNGSLTLNGTLTPGSNNITIGSSGSIIINGNANLGTFPFPAGAQSFANFTLNNSNGITFANNTTLTGLITLSSGALNFGGQTLTLNGTQVVTSGSLFANSSSSLVIGGTGSFGDALNFTSGGNTIGALTINRSSSGVVELNSTLNVSNNLFLSNGDLTNTNGLTMVNGSTLTRSGGTLSNDRPDVVSGSYNIIYNPGSSISTGLELPGPADLTQLNNLTISGPTVLTQNLTVNGNVSLSSGTFSCGTNTITMQGSTWSRAGGSFLPGTGQVIFNGTTTITASSGTPQLGSIRVETGRTLTFPSSTTAISGNATFIAGSTINANSGTILFNGSGAQNMGGGGATLNSITVNKSGGAVNLTSALGIMGVLNITSATVFSSSGNLTLLSTSDGTSGNASIASLVGGGSVTGDVTVQRFMSAEARVWRYLSSPIQNATVASWKDDFPITGSFTDPSTAGEWPVFSPPLTSSSISMYRYNETTVGTRDLGWEAFPTTGLASANPIEVGRGYSAFVRNTASTVIDVTGPINSGDISLPVTLTGTGGANNDNGWSIVGNPYPSSIDWDSPNWTKTNISGVVQIRDDPSGIFQTWNGSIGSMGSGRIATGQGFWVQAVGAPTLTARESVKTNTTGTFYKQDNQVPDAFEIILSKGTDKDFAYLWFKDDATEAVDAAYDAAKFNNDIFDFSIMNNGDKLAINTIPFLSCGSELKLDLSTTNTEFDLNGSYTMEFGELGAIDPSLQLQLFDTFTNSTMYISDGASYSFDVTDDLASFGSERFKLTLLAGPASFEVGETTAATSCKPGSVVLAASGAPSGGLYKWYESETSGASLLESSSSEFTTPVLDKSKTYYVSVANELGCESARKGVQAEVINFDDVVIAEAESELLSNYGDGNQWFRNDILIPGATAQNYKPEETGLYKVEVSIGSCKTSAERSVTITGLEDEAFFEGYVKIFPNPVSRELTIIVKQENSGSPRIIDLNGREMGKLEMNKENESWKGTFDFGGRAEGVYLLQVTDKNGKIFNKRIVKK